MEMLFKTKRVIFSLFSLLSLLLSLQVHSKDIVLFEVNNTDNGDRFNLVLEVNKHQEATGLKLFNTKERTWKNYNLADLTKGVALRVERGYEVIRLRSSDFEIDRGGNFQLNYLVNALTGNRKQLPLKFDFDGSTWQVFYKGEAIKRLDFIVNRFFGRNVGISSIKPFY
jgi:hypothetical protein